VRPGQILEYRGVVVHWSRGVYIDGNGWQVLTQYLARIRYSTRMFHVFWESVDG
jgi:hypothetical protein